MHQSSIKAFKEVFLKSFFIDLLFIILASISLVLVRVKLAFYMEQVQTYVQELMYQQESIEATNMAALDSLTNAVSPIATKAFLLIYLFAPLALFVLWSLSQGLIFSFIINKKASFRLILKFGLVNLPFFAAFTFLFYQGIFTINSVMTEGTGLGKMAGIIILFFVLNYVQFAFSCIVGIKKLKETPKEALRIAILKIHKVIPFFLIFAVVSLAVPISLLAIYVNLISALASPVIYLAIILILALVILSWFRAFLILRIRNLVK